MAGSQIEIAAQQAWSAPSSAALHNMAQFARRKPIGALSALVIVLMVVAKPF